MLLDIHHKYLGVTPITFEDINFLKFQFFIRPHSRKSINQLFKKPDGNLFFMEYNQAKKFLETIQSIN